MDKMKQDEEGINHIVLDDFKKDTWCIKLLKSKKFEILFNLFLRAQQLWFIYGLFNAVKGTDNLHIGLSIFNLTLNYISILLMEQVAKNWSEIKFQEEIMDLWGHNFRTMNIIADLYQVNKTKESK